MKYRSRIGVLLAAIMLGVFSLPLFAGKVQDSELMIIGIPFIFALSIFVTIGYSISANQLIVRVLGFKSATIDIKDIRSLKRSYNPLSSPAASMKRLEVSFYRKGKIEKVLISPVRETEFIGALREVNPDIRVDISGKCRGLLDWDI